MVTEVWFAQDVTQPIEVQHCKGVVFTNDNNGNKVGVRLFNGTAAYAPGGSVTCYVIRPDGVTVTFDGTVSNNALSATLPATALTVPGQISIVLQSVSGSTLTTVFKGVFGCEQGTTGTIVAPSVEVSTLAELTANKVNKSGDTMTGDLSIRKAIPAIQLYHSDSAHAMIYEASNNTINLRQYSPNGSVYAEYRLQTAADSDTTNTFNILTSRDVRIWNGTGGDDGLAGAVVHDAGMYNVMAYDPSDRTHYWYGFVAKADGQNPIITVLANNVITVRTYNSFGSLYFSGATSYAFRAMKIM